MSSIIKLLVGMVLPVFVFFAGLALAFSDEAPGDSILLGLVILIVVFGPLTHGLHPGKESPKTRIGKRYKTTSIISAGAATTVASWALYVGVSENNQEGYIGAILGLSYLVTIYYLYRYCAFRSTKKQLQPAFLNQLLKIFQAAPSLWLIVVSFGFIALSGRILG